VEWAAWTKVHVPPDVDQQQKALSTLRGSDSLHQITC
jgi:hypothetical protein